MANNIQVDKVSLADFCRRNHITRLSFFGSVLRRDFSNDSDIDVLVEFETEHIPGFIKIAQLERDLSGILGNRRVDLRTAEDLSLYFRNEVVSTAEVQYAQA
jgi:uncharacterized protein